MKNYFKKCCLLSLVLWGFAFAGVADVAGKDDDVESVKAMLKLCGHKKITVKLIALQEINEGDLEHVDILVLPDASGKIYESMKKNAFIRQEISEFVQRGGKVFAAGKAVKALPDKVDAVKLNNNTGLTAELLLKNL